MPRIFFFVFAFSGWLFLLRDFIFGPIPVNMDTNTIYGVTKFYFNNLLNGVVPLWEPFISLGRPFYAIAICNLFNPAVFLVPLLKICGLSYYHAFVIYMIVYFFIGCIGFYFLSLELFKDRYLASLSFLTFLFSSLGPSMFTQFTFVEMIVPGIWLFVFLLRFARMQTKGNFLGIAFAKMVLISSYLPFYFMTVFLCFLVGYVFLYLKELRLFCIHLWKFVLKNWRLLVFCVIGIGAAASPLLAYKVLDGSGDVVAPGRHCEYTSAQECYDRTMGRQGGMAYEEITRSGSLGERFDLQYLFGNLDKISYGSDSLLFLPFWVCVLLAVSLFLPLTRLTVLLSVMAFLVGLIALGSAASLHGFLFRHIFFFAYFRNLFFLGAFLIPVVILLAIQQLQLLLNAQPKDLSLKKLVVLGILFLHGLFFWFLKHYAGVPAVSFLTLGLSAAVFCVYFAAGARIAPRIWKCAFILILLIEPAWLFRAYAANAHEFASTLPSMDVKPVFAWVRPLEATVSHDRIYQFVPYEDFWYDMSMTDAPPVVGYPQSAARWTFDLAQHMNPRNLAEYARYKIVLYDALGGPGRPVNGPGPQLRVDYFDVNTLRLKTGFSKPQTVVYNDSYTTAWKAFLDGRNVELLRANQAFKAIQVPAGEHHIEFSYHPPGGRWVYAAATLSLFAFLLATVLILRQERFGV